MEPYRFTFLKPPEEHKVLQEELKSDLAMYMAGQQKTFPITEKLAASVSRWPRVPEGKVLTVYRGQPNAYANLPARTPFLSTTIGVDEALRFRGDKCCLFEIHVLPGTPFLITPNAPEYEVLIGQGVVREQTEVIKTVETNLGKKRMKIIEVTYGPATAGRRRKTRRRKRQLHSRRTLARPYWK
jgi:hypothetical protein